MSENQGPTKEEDSEGHLPARQPLLDHGWRLDYERMGICDARRFMPVQDLREVVSHFQARDAFDHDPPCHPPGSLLREVAWEEREADAERPLEELFEADDLDLLQRAGVPEEFVRGLIREGRIGPKVERHLPAEDLKAALEALESFLAAELCTAMVLYRQAHRGATFEQCREGIIGAGMIAKEWGIPEETWRQCWSRLEAERPL